MCVQFPICIRLQVGISAIWLPPPSESVSPQGYLPTDLYNLNSKYGTEAELRECITTLHEAGLKVIADIVINHRCAATQVRLPLAPGFTWTTSAGSRQHPGAALACVTTHHRA